PDHVTAFDVIGGHVAVDAELTARDANDDLVPNWNDGGRVGFADGGIAVDHLPLFLACLGIEGDQGGVSLVQEDGVVRVGEAAVDGVTAHHRDDVRILYRFILPDDAAVVVQIEGIDDVREGRVDIHDVPNHQRPAFMAPKDASREGPVHPEI